MSLQGTDKQWLVKVLYAFNAGEILITSGRYVCSADCSVSCGVHVGDLVAFKNMRPLWEQQVLTSL